jgi:hypothetical protein
MMINSHAVSTTKTSKYMVDNQPCTVSKDTEGGGYAYVLALYLHIGTEKTM